MADATIRFYAFIGGAWVGLDDVQPASGYWGMPDNKPETRIAKTGSMQVTLNNSSGKYSPGGPSALSGWGKGIPFRMLVTYDRKNRVRFRGFVDEIQLSSRPKEMKVHITALDWMSYALKYPIVNPSLLQDETVDTAFDAILDADSGPWLETYSTIFFNIVDMSDDSKSLQEIPNEKVFC